MSMEQILEVARSLPGVLVLSPTEGSEAPPIAWGDHFLYHAPDGVVPPGQPFATIVTKDYPDDTASRLDEPGRWRLNVHVGRARLAELVGDEPRDPAAVDTFVRHPVHGDQGWVSVVVPGERTLARALDLVREAHDAAPRGTVRASGGRPHTIRGRARSTPGCRTSSRRAPRRGRAPRASRRRRRRRSASGSGS